MAKSKINKKEPETIQCKLCLKDKGIRNFYASNKTEYKVKSNGKAPFCITCLKKSLVNKDNIVDTENFKTVLSQLDKVFIPSLYGELFLKDSSAELLPDYISRLNLNNQWKNMSFADSNKFEQGNNSNLVSPQVEQKIEYSKEMLKAKEDCIKLLGYDPFTTEQEIDKPKLYSMLIDYLDEQTLEDSFKIPTVVQIVKSFNQIDKIDSAVSEHMSKPENIISNSSSIKALFDTKKSMLASILNMAKDNGISVNHSNNKSKGSGTLSGLIKKLGELDLDEAKVNLFDIETAEGMKQVADISNSSIFQQLSLDENDYTEMIKEQRTMIENLREKVEKLEEENRKLKVSVKNINQESGDN